MVRCNITPTLSELLVRSPVDDNIIRISPTEVYMGALMIHSYRHTDTNIIMINDYILYYSFNVHHVVQDARKSDFISIVIIILY